MNKNIENVSLDDVSLEDIEAAATGSAVDAVEVTNVAEDVVTETVDAVEAATEEVSAEDTPVAAASAPTPVRKVGRPFDATGTTKLGKARLLFAENPGMSAGELKTLFVNKLGMKDQTAQTYASMVRRK